MLIPSEPAAQDDADDWHYSPQQAELRCKVSRRTIRRAIDEGSLPARQDAQGCWRIARRDLLRWAQDRQGSDSQKQGQSAETPTSAHVAALSEIVTLCRVVERLEATLTTVEAELTAARRKLTIAEANLAISREAMGDAQSMLQLAQTRIVELEARIEGDAATIRELRESQRAVEKKGWLSRGR